MNSKINKFQKFLACAGYIGIVGFISLFFVRKEEDQFLYDHVKSSSILFIVSLLVIPFCKLASKYYHFYLNSFFGLIAILIYIYIFYLKVMGIIRASKGLSSSISTNKICNLSLKQH